MVGVPGASAGHRPLPDATPREHKAQAPRSVACFVLTISDTKTPESDASGSVIRELLVGGGHRVAGSAIVRDDPVRVQQIVREQCDTAGVQAMILTGGTGITSRDTTFEAVEAVLDKRLPGFGELFRVLSYQEIGAAAMLSRAQAGIRNGRIVVSLPGSPNACRLALEKLLVPELGHLVREVNR
jgi:molybdenum cofactor biosynthesis protein B